jgi:hypothetical protein
MSAAPPQQFALTRLAASRQHPVMKTHPTSLQVPPSPPSAVRMEKCIHGALLPGLASLLLLSGCTDKTGVALGVMRDKAENRLLALAGEGEVAVELHRQQYADLKERLVQLKTLLSQHRDSLEQAYASDDARRIQIYTDLVTQLSDNIPKAESALREGRLAVEAQREEIRRIRDEIASVRAAGMISDTLELESDFQKRAALIRELTEGLRTKLRRAQALLEVNRTQETFPKP